MIMDALLVVPVDERLCLGVIHHETLLDRFLIIIGTATLLSAQDETLHQLILGHVEFDHRGHLVATLAEHLLQRLSLRDGTGEAIEDHPLVIAERVVDSGQDAHHQIVGDQLSLVDVAGGSLAQLRALLYLSPQHIAGGDVVQTILLNHLVALCALA